MIATERPASHDEEVLKVVEKTSNLNEDQASAMLSGAGKEFIDSANGIEMK
jgi:hypothetical protein